MLECRGFTLLELLVVVSIIVLMTAFTLPNHRSGDNQLALQRSAHKISQDLRRAQGFAISVKDFNGSTPGGYGIYFDLDENDRYIMFADLDGDQTYSGINEKAEEILLEGEIRLVGSSLTVFFTPPNPNVYFFPDAAIATINIGVETLQKTIKVNKAGLIFVE
ncbi:MAG: prepilin-type N-terminal cleavage/methylation domain-containing protein [Candidatus Nealsonbacteria bacterium]